MKAYINLEGDVTGEDSFYLKELANLIEQKCDLSVKIEKTGPQLGVKDSSLVIGLNIASLTLTAIAFFFLYFTILGIKRTKWGKIFCTYYCLYSDSSRKAFTQKLVSRKDYRTKRINTSASTPIFS